MVEYDPKDVVCIRGRMLCVKFNYFGFVTFSFVDSFFDLGYLHCLPSSLIPLVVLFNTNNNDASESSNKGKSTSVIISEAEPTYGGYSRDTVT